MSNIRTRRFSSNVSTASRTPINGHKSHVRKTMQLEDALFSFLIAFCTKPMNWFGAACLFFQNASKRPSKNLFQLIPLLLSFPCFEISHLFFKLAYFFQQRKALILSRKCTVVGIDDFGLEFDKLPLKRGSIPETYHCLRNILCRLERSQGARECGHVNHSPFPEC
jgi:hypothetical protein